MPPPSGVNFVKIYFYQGHTISTIRQQKLVALAYATARDQRVAPTAILIRSDIHNTTSVKGKHAKDPLGWHGTFAFKYSGQANEQYHVASHGYTQGKEDFALSHATHGPEKPDVVKRGGPKSEKVVWPEPEDLEEYSDSPIGYSHLPK